MLQFSPQRHGDEAIMSLFTTLGKRKMVLVNACQLYIRALMVSDIVTADGHSLYPWVLQGNFRIPSKWTWPTQPKPPEEAWRAWRLFLRVGLTLDKLEVLSPLGQWDLKDPHKVYDPVWIPTLESICYQFHNHWVRHECTKVRQQLKLKTSAPITCSFPEKFIPIDIKHQDGIIAVVPKGKNPSRCQNRNGFLDLDSEAMALVGHMNVPSDQCEDIIEALNNNRLAIGGDGSCKLGTSSYAYIIKKLGSAHALYGGGCTHSHPLVTSSLTGESMSALAITIIMKALQDKFSISETAGFTVVIDNACSVSRMNSLMEGQLPHPLDPEYNCYEKIMSIMSTMTCKGKWMWIRSHQSNDDPWHQLNDDADTLAKEYWEMTRDRANKSTTVSNTIQISINNYLVNSNYSQVFHREYTDTMTEDYIKKKCALSEEQW